MPSHRFLTSLLSILSLLLTLHLTATPVDGQAATTLALLSNVTLFYNDNITSTPPAFQSALYNATAAIFQGTSMNGAPSQTSGSATSGDLSLVRFNESYAAATGARCMDGSVYSYYIRRTSVTANAGKWLVYMQGGSLCVDPISCGQRALGPLGSSKNYLPFYTDNTNVISTLAAVNPQFYNWNIVALPYCSGDVWGGSATSNTTNPLFPYYFAGYNITTATIRHLIDTANLGAATDIVLSGTSAGGIGVFVNVDQVAAAVPTARTVGYPQAGWFTVAEEFPQWFYGASQGSATSTRQRPYYDSVLFQVLAPMFDTFRYVAGDACSNYFINTLRQPGNVTQCASMPVLYRFIRSPLFILENKYDAFQIANLNVVPLTAAFAAQTVNYLIYYGTQMITSIATLVATKPNSVDAYFIPSCFQHPTYPTPITGYNATVNGQQAYQTFQNWYNALSTGALTSAAALAPYRLADVSNYLPLASCSITSAYSLPTTPVTPPTSVRGDPQFVGLRGQSFQVHGIDGAVYNLISDASVQINARFTFLDSDAKRQCPVMPTTGKRSSACWTHPGSYLTEVGVQLASSSASSSQRVRIVAGSAVEGLIVSVDGVLGGQSSAVEVLSSHEVRVVAGRFTIEVENIDGFVNVRQVDVSGGLDSLTSHGLLGQTWSTQRHASTLKVIEGEVDDYVVAEDDVFGSGFVYNQFSA